MRASAITPALVTALNRVDLRRWLVAHRASVPSGTESRCRRCGSSATHASKSSRSILILRPILRRSVSSLVSPGPRVPIPPPRRDISLPWPVRRGCKYISWASSTCRRPSRVRARRAKMSRINCVRSSTLAGRASSRLRCCVGVRSWSNTTRSARRELASAASSRTLPWPNSVAASGAWRAWLMRSSTSAPALAANSANSSRDSSGSLGQNARACLAFSAGARPFHSMPTRIARSCTTAKTRL